MFSLYLGALATLCGAPLAGGDQWWSISALRRFLDAPGATPVAHWAGPEAKRPDAAFLALHVPQAGFRSIVALNDGTRVQFNGAVRVVGRLEFERISSLDVEGVRTGERVVLFHSGDGVLRSAFSFEVVSNLPRLKYMVTGVSAGVWEVWRNGWVVDIGVVSRAGQGVLYFEERPGSFFVRKLN